MSDKVPPDRALPSAPSIALVMIARDEAASIAQCLCSVRGLVDEMIVLDTGSTDATMAIARDNGARVYQWAWQDDFAAARNEALSYSKADWNLILDADECLLGDGRLLRQAVQQAAASDQSFVGVLPIHSQVEATVPTDQSAAEVQTVVSWIPRLLPRGVLYTGRIHEQPGSDLSRRRLSVEIGHDGYRWQMMAQKKGRNRRLLLEAVGFEPENPYLWYQLGKDYDIYAEPALALDCYEKALHRVLPNQGYRIDLVVRTIVCLTRTGALELGYQFAEDEMENCRQSPDFFYVLAELLCALAAKQSDRGLSQWLPLARVSLLFCLNIGDTPDIIGSVSGRGKQLAAHSLSMLDQLLARLTAPA
jgi:hypothetical protein